MSILSKVVVIAPGVGHAFQTPEPGHLYGLDVESTYMTDRAQFDPDFRVRTIQFGLPDEALVLRTDDPVQLKAAVTVLENPRNTFTCHTPMDILAVWAAYGVWVGDRTIDTYELSAALIKEKSFRDGEADFLEEGYDSDTFGRDLKSMCTREGMPELAEADKALDDRFKELWKAAGGKGGGKKAEREEFGFNNIDVSDPVFSYYAGLDASAVCILATKLLKRFSHEYVETLMHIYAETVWRRAVGLRVDLEFLEEHYTPVKEEQERLNEQFEGLTGLRPTQKVKLVQWFESHGADFSHHPKTTKGGVSLSKKNAAELRALRMDDEGERAVDLLLKVAETDNRVKIFEKIKAMVDPNDRIHPWIVLNGTRTSRMASRGGLNLQNFKKGDYRLRGVIKADPGHVFIACDYAQIELRVAAAMAGEQSLADAVRRGDDLHQVTADRIGADRQVGKTLNFAALYGAGGKKIAETAGISTDEGYEALRNFWSAYPEITRYKEKIRPGTRKLPDGYEVLVTPTRTYAGLNYDIQGFSRTLLVYGWRRFSQHFPGAVMAPIHDELWVQVREEEADRALKVLEESMTFEFNGMPIECEAVVLRDEHGVSRWMSGEHAREVASNA